MADKYANFAALARNEQAGVDYAVAVRRARRGFALVAPHGGGIEAGTSEIADAKRGDFIPAILLVVPVSCGGFATGAAGAGDPAASGADRKEFRPLAVALPERYFYLSAVVTTNAGAGTSPSGSTHVFSS